MKHSFSLRSGALACLLGLAGNLAAQSAEPKAVAAPASGDSALVNFGAPHLQITRFDSVAAAIDAHDGEISYFQGTFYLYGTSYDCGYEWGRAGAPFCGFKVYSSHDLVNWTDRGFLFDAQTPLWQSRCNGNTFGCYRPHVVYNQKNKLYVLWINVNDNQVGYRIFVSPTPTGPFSEIAEPKLAFNTDASTRGGNNGDHDVFRDDDGTAYLAYTDWKLGGAIIVEKLNDDYTSGTGAYVKVTDGHTEAPALLKRAGKYYVLYSDPNCGYCAGTGTSYRSAPSPLGPWSNALQISTDSCGGQPSFVSTIKLGSDVIFLYGSDLWNNAAKNEALANFYWAPLTFAPDGSINPIVCQDKVSLSLPSETRSAPAPADLDASSGSDGFTTFWDIGGSVQRSQSFIATRTGTLSAVSFCTFQNGYPDAGLKLEIYRADASGLPAGDALSSILVLPEAVSWGPQMATVHPGLAVQAGQTYALVVKSASAKGRYGFEYSDAEPYAKGRAAYSSDGGKTYAIEKQRSLMFRTFVAAEKPVPEPH